LWALIKIAIIEELIFESITDSPIQDDDISLILKNFKHLKLLRISHLKTCHSSKYKF